MEEGKLLILTLIVTVSDSQLKHKDVYIYITISLATSNMYNFMLLEVHITYLNHIKIITFADSFAQNSKTKIVTLNQCPFYDYLILFG